MYTVVNDLNVSQVSRLKNTYVKTVYKEEMGFSMLICCLKKERIATCCGPSGKCRPTSMLSGKCKYYWLN